jgi:asparaginyl-tRNA synthetase
MAKITIVAARHESAIGNEVTIEGWVRTRRDSKGGFSFLEINDGTCLANLQVIVDADVENYESEVKQLTAGCSVSITGAVKASGGKGQATELQAATVFVHGWADPLQYPLQKKHHSSEKLREWMHLRPRTNSIGAVARVRNCICKSIHDFFQEEGFLYVHTPIITTSDCEGAGEMFRVTTLDADKPPRTDDGQVDFNQDFFDRPSYLTVSGQLQAEIYATALGKVYTFGPTFRAENSNTSRHLSEFWMIEPEMAFFDLDDDMALAERFLKRIFNDALTKCADDIQFFNDKVDDTVIATLTGIVESQFHRISYTDAIETLLNAKAKFEFAVEWGIDLQSEHEQFLTAQFGGPVIVHDYPSSIKPFYMRVNDDGKTVRAMDVLVPKVGEIIGGSQREERLDVLESRMAEQNLDPEEYWWYVDLRRYGTVPHAGFGLGLERVVQFVTGMSNIRDVIPFPRTPGSAKI